MSDKTRTTIYGNDFQMKYPTVLRFDVYVNTNEDIHEVLARIQKAARGQCRAAVIAAGSLYAGTEAQQVWESLQRLVVTTAANPKAIDVDEDLKPVK